MRSIQCATCSTVSLVEAVSRATSPRRRTWRGDGFSAIVKYCFDAARCTRANRRGRSLVAVDKGMVCDDGMEEGGSLLDRGLVNQFAESTLEGPRDCRIKQGG